MSISICRTHDDGSGKDTAEHVGQELQLYHPELRSVHSLLVRSLPFGLEAQLCRSRTCLKKCGSIPSSSMQFDTQGAEGGRIGSPLLNQASIHRLLSHGSLSSHNRIAIEIRPTSLNVTAPQHCEPVGGSWKTSSSSADCIHFTSILSRVMQEMVGTSSSTRLVSWKSFEVLPNNRVCAWHPIGTARSYRVASCRTRLPCSS